MQATTFPRLAIATAISLSFVHANADDGVNDLDGEQLASLDPVVVTATRAPQLAESTLAPTTVITREQIERSGTRSLSDLLSGRAGADVSTSGGFGKQTTFFQRGLATGQSLYMIDGVPIYDSVGIEGAPSLEFIPMSQVERVEIVRGPRSTLYGSEAMGGVVNIITRDDTATGPSVSAGVGSLTSSDVTASYSGVHERTRYGITVNRFRTSGIDVRDDDFDDRDGFENLSGSIRFRHEATDALSFSVRGLRSEGETEFDNCFDGFAGPFGDCRTDFVRENLNVAADYDATAAWSSRLSYGWSREERENFTEGDAVGEFNGATDRISWLNDFHLHRDWIYTVGLERRRDRAKEPDNFTEDGRTTDSLFAQMQGFAGNHDWVLGVRGIDDEVFGSQDTYNIDYAYTVTPNLRLLAGTGTAYKAPTLFQLFSPGFGNEDLDPETSRSVEIGFEASGDFGDLGVRAFRNHVDDLIAFTDNTYFNIDEARVTGLEIELGTEIGEWDTSIATTWLDAIDNDTKEPLPNRASQTARLDVDRNFQQFSFGATVLGQSARSASDFTERVAGFGLLNLRAAYRINRDWRVRGIVDNVFDHDYQTRDGFFEPGRVGFVYLDYRPGGI